MKHIFVYFWNFIMNQRLHVKHFAYFVELERTDKKYSFWLSAVHLKQYKHK